MLAITAMVELRLRQIKLPRPDAYVARVMRENGIVGRSSGLAFGVPKAHSIGILSRWVERPRICRGGGPVYDTLPPTWAGELCRAGTVIALL